MLNPLILKMMQACAAGTNESCRKHACRLGQQAATKERRKHKVVVAYMTQPTLCPPLPFQDAPDSMQQARIARASGLRTSIKSMKIFGAGG